MPRATPLNHLHIPFDIFRERFDYLNVVIDTVCDSQILRRHH